MSDMVGNTKDQFSGIKAKLMTWLVYFGWLFAVDGC